MTLTCYTFSMIGLFLISLSSWQNLGKKGFCIKRGDSTDEKIKGGSQHWKH